MSDAHGILLVEDNDDDVALIRRAFRRAGIDSPLEVASDGDAAVARLQALAASPSRALPRLVLLDLKLPRRSGLEVLEWLRATPDLRHVVVVILTSSRENADLRRAYELGANSFLVKPVEFDDLLEMVRTADLYWLRMNQTAPPPAQRP